MIALFLKFSTLYELNHTELANGTKHANSLRVVYESTADEKGIDSPGDSDITEDKVNLNLILEVLKSR